MQDVNHRASQPPVFVDADCFAFSRCLQFVETPATPQKEDEELLQLFSLKMLVGQLDSMITKKYACQATPGRDAGARLGHGWLSVTGGSLCACPGIVFLLSLIRPY
jgi:hypothetical protein